MNDHTQQRVIVTAGASGIGRSIAEIFLEHGARVYVCDISSSAIKEVRDALPAVGAAVADASDETQMTAFFQEAVAALGGLDVLVNNVGIAGPTMAIEHIKPEDWRRTIDVNINGHFYVTRHAVPVLKAAGGGSIVNVSSIAGRLGYPFRTPYAASKWAIVGLTKSLAIELGRSNIRVNAVLPGAVDGDRVRAVFQARAAGTGRTMEQEMDDALQHVSLHRLVTARDVAETIFWLASPAACNITGQAISVDGDIQKL